jgi:hypothetical protein
MKTVIKCLSGGSDAQPRAGAGFVVEEDQYWQNVTSLLEDLFSLFLTIRLTKNILQYGFQLYSINSEFLSSEHPPLCVRNSHNF